MNTILWQNIEAYDLDLPLSACTFSIRLANENCWTTNFTRKAILEYKKFMYLAATADGMVSPSSIVDVVWHQHLTYTQSYAAFCKVLGKEIHHYPSTQTTADQVRLKAAADRTAILYEGSFGRQPDAWWVYDTMTDALQLPQAKVKVNTQIVIAVACFFIMLPFAKEWLRPLYLQIRNPYFLYGYAALVVAALLLLRVYSQAMLKKLICGFANDAFVFDLTAAELTYLKLGGIKHVVYGSVSKLLDSKRLLITADGNVVNDGGFSPADATEFAIYDMVDKYETLNCRSLLKNLGSVSVFRGNGLAMEAVKDYIHNSKYFCRLFLINMVVPVLLFMCGAARYLIGSERGKPTGFIVIVLCLFACMLIFHLYTLYRSVGRSVLPTYYEVNIQKDNRQYEWDWQYFLFGTVVLSPFITPFIIEPNEMGNGGGDGSSGGCGGDGGGCGGGCGGCGGD